MRMKNKNSGFGFKRTLPAQPHLLSWGESDSRRHVEIVGTPLSNQLLHAEETRE
jgi:hypothetical protein